MLMTPARLVALRLYGLTLGRLPVFERLLRRVGVHWLVRRRTAATRYVAASRYFDFRDVDR